VASLTVTHDVDAAGRDELLRPRADVVAETELSPGLFGLLDGPFDHYERSALVEPTGAGRYHVTEQMSWTLAIPYFGWVFWWPARWALRNWRRRDGRQPWWAPAQRLDARSSHVLGSVAMAAVFAGYLGTVVSQTMTFAADEFGASDTAQGAALASVRIGALIALGVVALADRRGRQRVALVSVACGIVLTASGALAPSLGWLAVSQVAGRSFATALGILIAVMIVEEMPAGARAYGASLAGMAGALGGGMCVAALVLADLGERGWRLVYLVPLLGLPVLPGLARRLPESKRFQPQAHGVRMAGHWRTFALVATTLFCVNLFVGPASQFRNEYLTDELGWSAALISAFVLITATPAGLGVFFGGRLADVFGRRRVGPFGLVVGMSLVAAMFLSDGVWVWVLGFLGTAIAGMYGPVGAVYGPELFPSAIRNRANGGITLVQITGSAAGLLAAGVLSDRVGRLGPGMVLLVLGPMAAAALIWFRYPETTRRELEELNPEDAVLDDQSPDPRMT
jgi:MFS family permease